MLCRHMPGGAHGILSLLTVVFVLPEGECCSPQGVGAIWGVTVCIPPINPSCLGVIYPRGEFKSAPAPSYAAARF